MEDPDRELLDRRDFGVPPHGPLALLALLAFVAAIVLLATGQLIAGLLVLAAALGLAALWTEQVRRRRDSAFDRAAVEAARRSRAVAGLAAAWTGTWSETGTRVARLRGEARLLARRRGGLLRRLGEAAYEGDIAAVAKLTDELRTLDARIAALDARARAAVAQARRRSRRERLAVQRTEPHRPVS